MNTSTEYLEVNALNLRDTNEAINLGERPRLTNGLSKRWENLWAACCPHFAYYNFCRVHRSLRVTPAMECGIANHFWTIQELLA